MHEFLEWIVYVLSEEMSFEGFSPIWSHVNENEKKIVKNQKMQNFEQHKNDVETWWKGTFPPNLALVCLTGSDKTVFTEGGRMDDGRARDDSSSDVQ